MVNSKKKTLIITISIFVVIAIIVGLCLGFDLSSKFDLLRHPEKYSFNISLSSSILQEDYAFSKFGNKFKSTYVLIKIIENKYSDKTDDNSLKMMSYINMTLDLYHDILLKKSINKKDYILSDEDYILMCKNDSRLCSVFSLLNMIIPQEEPKNLLLNELEIRKNLIKEIKRDLQRRNIIAKVSIDNIEFENLSPAYMDYKNTPYYINDFRNLVMDDISKEIGNNINKIYALGGNLNENNVNNLRKLQTEAEENYWDKISNINVKWKNRYIIKAIETKKDDTKIIHLYKAYRYKDGNKYYWDIEYVSPDSEFLKAYLKMIELLVNL